MTHLIKILAVDGEEIVLKSIRKALENSEESNYDIVTCTTALEGLKLIGATNLILY